MTFVRNPNRKYKEHNVPIWSHTCENCGATDAEVIEGIKPDWCKEYTEQEVLAGKVFRRITK